MLCEIRVSFIGFYGSVCPGLFFKVPSRFVVCGLGVGREAFWEGAGPSGSHSCRMGMRPMVDDAKMTRFSVIPEPFSVIPKRFSVIPFPVSVTSFYVGFCSVSRTPDGHDAKMRHIGHYTLGAGQ